MGEEKKEPEGEKKSEDVKNKDVEKEEKPTIENKPKGEEKKSEENKENKDSKQEPPLPPPEIVFRVFMHCEGCARKVRKCLKGFNGVEDVVTDCKTHKVVVKGEKADPLMILDRLQKKTHRQVELLSPIPPPKPAAPEGPKKTEEKDPPKPIEEKKEEPKVITVVLKVHMHCEACSLEIKKRIEKMKEVEEAIPDLNNSQVTVKGTFEAAKLVSYVYKRTGRRATVVKQDPPPEKKDDDKGGKEEKKAENGEDGKKAEEKGEEGKGDKKEEAAGGGDGKAAADGGDGAATAAEEGPKILEMKRNEFNYYPPRYPLEYAFPPQIFSDENPNACSIM